jgi:hypothetical protein
MRSHVQSTSLETEWYPRHLQATPVTRGYISFIAGIIWLSSLEISTVLGILQLKTEATNIWPCCNLNSETVERSRMFLHNISRDWSELWHVCTVGFAGYVSVCVQLYCVGFHCLSLHVSTYMTIFRCVGYFYFQRVQSVTT